MKKTLLHAYFVAVFATAGCASTLSLEAIPGGGAVSAGPGDVAGWGFTLTNTTTDWVVLNDSFFTGSTVFGNYMDYLVLPGAPLYEAGPAPENSTVMQTWDGTTSPPLGLGEFDLNQIVPPGTLISGQIGVDYTLFSQDPNSPTFDPASFVSSGQFFTPVTVFVAPEPGSVLLIGAGLLGLGLARRRKHAR